MGRAIGATCAERTMLALLVGQLACTSRTADDKLPPCPGAPQDSEGVVCDFDGAWMVEVTDDRVLWVAGAPSGCVTLNPPCGPARYGVVVPGEAPVTGSLDTRPVDIADAGVVVIGTETSVLTVDEIDGLTELHPGGVWSVEATGQDVYWIAREPGGLWHHEFGETEASPELVLEIDAARTIGLAISADRLAWAQYPEDNVEGARLMSVAVDGSEPVELATEISLIWDVEAAPGRFLWTDAHGVVFAVPADGSEPAEPIAESWAPAAADGDRIFVRQRTSDGTNLVMALDTDGGSSTPVLQLEPPSGWRAASLRGAHDGFVYWSYEHLNRTAVPQ